MTPRSAPPAAARMGGHSRLLLAAALLAALTLAAFAPLAANRGFVFDDEGYVFGNPQVRAGLAASGLRWAFTTFETANWHPLAWLSHMLDVELFGLDARGHHATSLALHLANALLLFLGLRALTGALWPSWAAAALFAVHPLHVESVAWISERKDLLCTLFGLLAAGAWLRAVRRGDRRLLLAAAACHALSLLSKPMLVTLPFALLLLDWWPLGRLGGPRPRAPHAVSAPRLRACLAEKIPLLALSAASAVVTVIAQARGEALRSLAELPLASRAGNSLVAYATYLRQALWPADLAAFYPLRPENLTAAAAGAALLLAAVTAAAAARARRAPHLLAGWLFFLGTLVPVIGLVQVGEQALADRYTYVPLAGLFVALAWGLRARLAAPAPCRGCTAAAAVAALLALAAATAAQTRHWRDAGALWTRAIAVTRGNWFAHNNLGVWRFKNGDNEGAIEEFTRSLEIRPAHVEAIYNRAFALAKLGRLDEAGREARAALAIAPRWVLPRTLLATTLFRAGRWEEARREYVAALRIDPRRAETHRLFADALHASGELVEAELRFREALRLDPAVAETHNELGVLLARTGRLREAAGEFRAALALRPEYPDARYNLEKALYETGRDVRPPRPEATAAPGEAPRAP